MGHGKRRIDLRKMAQRKHQVLSQPSSRLWREKKKRERFKEMVETIRRLHQPPSPSPPPPPFFAALHWNLQSPAPLLYASLSSRSSRMPRSPSPNPTQGEGERGRGRGRGREKGRERKEERVIFPLTLWGNRLSHFLHKQLATQKKKIAKGYYCIKKTLRFGKAYGKLYHGTHPQLDRTPSNPLSNSPFSSFVFP